MPSLLALHAPSVLPPAPSLPRATPLHCSAPAPCTGDEAAATWLCSAPPAPQGPPIPGVPPLLFALRTICSIWEWDQEGPDPRRATLELWVPLGSSPRLGTCPQLLPPEDRALGPFTVLLCLLPAPGTGRGLLSPEPGSWVLGPRPGRGLADEGRTCWDSSSGHRSWKGTGPFLSQGPQNQPLRGAPGTALRCFPAEELLETSEMPCRPCTQ